jgi:hypothetical protein
MLLHVCTRTEAAAAAAAAAVESRLMPAAPVLLLMSSSLCETASSSLPLAAIASGKGAPLYLHSVHAIDVMRLHSVLTRCLFTVCNKSCAHLTQLDGCMSAHIHTHSSCCITAVVLRASMQGKGCPLCTCYRRHRSHRPHHRSCVWAVGLPV